MSTIPRNRLRKIKEQLNNGKSHWVNGPEVWTRPEWMMIDDDGLIHAWLFSAVLLAYLLVYRKNSGKFPALYFSGKVTALAVTTRVCFYYHSQCHHCCNLSSPAEIQDE